jgi:hypothetical protein
LEYTLNMNKEEQAIFLKKLNISIQNSVRETQGEHFRELMALSKKFEARFKSLHI